MSEASRRARARELGIGAPIDRGSAINSPTKTASEERSFSREVRFAEKAPAGWTISRGPSRRPLIERKTTGLSGLNLQANDADSDEQNARPLPSAQRLPENEKGGHLEQTESSADAECVNQVRIPVFQRQGDENRAEEPNRVSSDEPPPESGGSGFLGGNLHG